MKISTFEEDFFDLSGFAKRLRLFIETEKNFVDGSLVLALSSKYGTGKTTFLEMWKRSLEQESETTDSLIVISLNAWESDYYGDPLFAIISALTSTHIDEKQTKVIKAKKSLENAVKDLGWFTLGIGNQLVIRTIDIDIVAAGNFAKKKKQKREEDAPVIPDSFSIYQQRKEAMETLKKEIDKFVKASQHGVLFLIDELDRCRPDYAITYLETIKHIFDIKGAVFLLSADREHLENSAKTAFGPNLDFEEYYRKFVHREVTLPAISEEGYKKLTRRYVSYYLNRINENRHLLEEGENQTILLITKFSLTPRQIQEVFRLLRHLLDTENIEEVNAEKKKAIDAESIPLLYVEDSNAVDVEDIKAGMLGYCLIAGTILMATLRIAEPEIYHRLGNQELESKKAFDFFQNKLGADNAEWWFLLLLTGDGLRKNENETKSDLIRDAGFTSEKINEYEEKGYSSHTLECWIKTYNDQVILGDIHSISEIYNRIETISQWY